MQKLLKLAALILFAFAALLAFVTDTQLDVIVGLVAVGLAVEVGATFA